MLFSIGNSLCKVDNRYDTLPPLNGPQILANDFGAFFIKKFELIQEDIANIVVNQSESDSYHLCSKLERFFFRLTEYSVQRHVIKQGYLHTSPNANVVNQTLLSCVDACYHSIAKSVITGRSFICTMEKRCG